MIRVHCTEGMYIYKFNLKLIFVIYSIFKGYFVKEIKPIFRVYFEKHFCHLEY